MPDVNQAITWTNVDGLLVRFSWHFKSNITASDKDIIPYDEFESCPLKSTAISTNSFKPDHGQVLIRQQFVD